MLYLALQDPIKIYLVRALARAVPQATTVTLQAPPILTGPRCAQMGLSASVQQITQCLLMALLAAYAPLEVIASVVCNTLALTVTIKTQQEQVLARSAQQGIFAMTLSLLGRRAMGR
jgi:hypothetical protein